MKNAEKELILQQKLQEMKRFENALYEQGLQYVAGVDEVGRGPLAGPVVAAAVVLPRDFSILGVDDSKKLSEKKREALYDLIREKAIAYGIGIVDNEVIDKINILEATKAAMEEAVAQANRSLQEASGCPIEHILIDALTLKSIAIPQTGIIKGDAASVSIAAASILAKVTRDRMMAAYHDVYPGYSFDQNKGYGTKAHYEGLSQLGACLIHRRSFLKNNKEAAGQ